MLYYVDEFPHIGFKPKQYTYALNIIYRLKKGFVTPDRYMGAKVDNIQLEDGRLVWYTKCDGYLKSTIENANNSLGVYK